MQQNQTVADMADDVLVRQAEVRATRTGEAVEEALKTILETEAGQRLRKLRDGPHRDESARRWQEELRRERDEEHNRAQREERSRVRQQERSRAQLATWKSFMQTERRELELRKDGQLAKLLSDPLPEEQPAALERLAFADQKQAKEGLVALMSSGKVFYKPLEKLSEEDMPARIAASRLRTAWLKERQEVWGGYGG